MRIAANFGIGELRLVRPMISPDDPEVADWACGAEKHLKISAFPEVDAALRPFRTVVGTASGRGRPDHPVISPAEAGRLILKRGPGETALVFGNETRGLSRRDLEACDLVVRIPTEENFPVLNLAQAIALLTGFLSFGFEETEEELPEKPASHEEVEGLMGHLEESLMEIGYLDPLNPERILVKLRRILARAAVTAREVIILRGICRQIRWAARTAPMAGGKRKPGRFEQSTKKHES